MEEESGEEMEREKYDEDSEDLFESIQKFFFMYSYSLEPFYLLVLL